MHIHTTAGSDDSVLSPEALVLEAERLGLMGLCITEHNGPWNRKQFEDFAGRHNIVLVRAMEVDTDLGHILAFGLDSYQEGFEKAEYLRKEADKVGGFIVSAHPFRGVLSGQGWTRPKLYQAVDDSVPDTPEEAMGHPVFKLIDAVEVANGGTIDKENEFALKVAELLRLPITGGSDAHSVSGLGKCLTAFQDELHNEAEFLAALRSGMYFPAVGLRAGQVRPYTI